MSGVGSAVERLNQWLAVSPFHRLFEMSAIAADDAAGTLTLRLGFTSAVQRSEDSDQFHGGAIASLIDIAGDMVLALQLERAIPTVDLRVDYLRPARGGAILAHARVRRAGRTVGVVDIEVMNDAGQLVALGRGCFGTSASAPAAASGQAHGS